MISPDYAALKHALLPGVLIFVGGFCFGYVRGIRDRQWWARKQHEIEEEERRRVGEE